MDIRHKHVKDMTPREYRACYRANYGLDQYGSESGYMRPELDRCKKGFPGEVIMIWNDTHLIGWALLTPVRTYGLLSVTRWVMKRSKYTVQVWVNTKYRRKGYGKVLMNEVKKLDPRPHVIPHDDASSELFSSYKVQVLAMDRDKMKPNKPKIA